MQADTLWRMAPISPFLPPQIPIPAHLSLTFLFFFYSSHHAVPQRQAPAPVVWHCGRK